jgi:hypothetical protein
MQLGKPSRTAWAAAAHRADHQLLEPELHLLRFFRLAHSGWIGGHILRAAKIC